MSETDREPERPNVVVVCCDDLGYGDLGCYGAEYDTPNVDALAGAGVRFTDWHSMAPVCSPARASYLTGRYPQRAGVPGNVPAGRGAHSPGVAGLPAGQSTLADRLSAAGYATGAVGKWHLGMGEADGPLNHGFDCFFGFRSGCVDYYSHTFVWGQGNDIPPYHDLFEDGEEVYRDGEYLTDLIAERAAAFVREHAEESGNGGAGGDGDDASEEGASGESDDPFFLYTAFNAPHYPLHAPDRYREREDVADLPPERRAIAAMVAAVDEGVGRILDALAATGQREETLVVFTSDHGPSREVRNHLDGSDTPFEGGSTGGFRGAKFSLFEGGIRVPGIVVPPAGEANTDDGVSDAFAAGIDLVPTVLDYCGLDAGEMAPEGTSLRPAVEGSGTVRAGEAVVWESGDARAVRRDDWKLVSEDGETVLADLDADPGERTDRSDDRPELVAELEAAGHAWAAENG